MTPQQYLCRCVFSLCLVGGTAQGSELNVLPDPTAQERAAELGVLLFSQNERAAIRALRRGESPTGSSALQRFDGVVLRSSGKDTVFWGGAAYPKGDRSAPTLQGLDAQKDGKRLRVGDAIDTTTGQAQRPLPDSARVSRQK